MEKFVKSVGDANYRRVCNHYYYYSLYFYQRRGRCSLYLRNPVCNIIFNGMFFKFRKLYTVYMVNNATRSLHKGVCLQFVSLNEQAARLPGRCLDL